MTHIRLLAPSSRLLPDDVALARDYFEGQGFEVSAPADISGEDLLCANTDEARFAHLKDALLDDTVDVIWQMRGGYGLTRIAPQLLDLPKPAKPKLFVGFSDGSILHLFLNQVWGWPSLHGVVGFQMFRKEVNDSSAIETIRVVKEGLETARQQPLEPLNNAAKAMTTLEGKVVGGNLCLTTLSLGTRLPIDPSGKILFLEDIDERGYSVDRCLSHLRQAGTLDNVKAVIFGDFTRSEEKTGGTLIPPVLERFAQEVSFPVFRAIGYGHDKDNFPLPFNVLLSFSIHK